MCRFQFLNQDHRKERLCSPLLTSEFEVARPERARIKSSYDTLPNDSVWIHEWIALCILPVSRPKRPNLASHDSCTFCPPYPLTQRPGLKIWSSQTGSENLSKIHWKSGPVILSRVYQKWEVFLGQRDTKPSVPQTQHREFLETPAEIFFPRYDPNSPSHSSKARKRSSMEDSKRSSRMDNLTSRAEGRRSPPKEKQPTDRHGKNWHGDTSHIRASFLRWYVSLWKCIFVQGST